MKKIFFILIVLSLFVACKKEAATPVDESAVTEITVEAYDHGTGKSDYSSIVIFKK